MKSPPPENGAAGLAQQKGPKVALLAAPAASPPAPAATAAPRLFKGVRQQQSGSFVASACLGSGKQRSKGSFRTAEAAAHAYDEMMGEHKYRVVNFPQLPGEIQAVYGEQDYVTLARHKQDPNRQVQHVVVGLRLVTAPPTVGDTRQYKGVRKSSKYRYGAFGRLKEALGHFDTAKEAADAYDAHVRKTSGSLPPVVNTPLLAGEIQAVPGEHDSVSRRRAAAEAAPAAPKPKRSRLSDLPAPMPPTPLPPAPRPPALPASAAAIVAASGDDDAVAFLRRISPPLSDIDRVAAAAADAGMQMSHLRAAVRAPAHEGASRLHMIYDILGICCAADKIALTVALLPLAA